MLLLRLLLPVIESKKLMQNSDPHNLLIISKGDQLDADQSLKDAIINDPLLHTNLLSNQGEFQGEFQSEFQSEHLLGTGNNLELDVLSHHDLAKSTGAEFAYADTLKQLHLEPNCLLPSLQSALEENLANLMNSGSAVNAVATLSRQQQFGNPLSSPHHKAYITKSTLDNRIIYSTISNIANAVSSPIELNSGAIQQLTGNQSAGQLSTNNGSDLIEMSVNSPTTIYAMSMVGAFRNEALCKKQKRSLSPSLCLEFLPAQCIVSVTGRKFRNSFGGISPLEISSHV